MVVGLGAVDSTAGVAWAAAPNGDIVEAAVVVAEAVVVAGAAVVVVEGVAVDVGVEPNRLRGFGASEAVIGAAGFPNWSLGGSVVVALVAGLFAFPKSEGVCDAAGAGAGVEVLGV